MKGIEKQCGFFGGMSCADLNLNLYLYKPHYDTKRLKGELYASGVLAFLLYGGESRCLTDSSVRRFRSWHNKRVREMFRVTI